MEISTQVTIDGSISDVWAALTGFDGYPKWNPFITNVSGTVREGNVIEVVLQQPGIKPITMKPTILVFKEGKELRWIGHLLFPGLFDGEHCFRLETGADGSTTFYQKERFSGLLVPLFKKMLELNTRAGFETMNQRLKEIVEGGK